MGIPGHPVQGTSANIQQVPARQVPAIKGPVLHNLPLPSFERQDLNGGPLPAELGIVGRKQNGLSTRKDLGPPVSQFTALYRVRYGLRCSAVFRNAGEALRITEGSDDKTVFAPASATERSIA